MSRRDPTPDTDTDLESRPLESISNIETPDPFVVDESLDAFIERAVSANPRPRGVATSTVVALACLVLTAGFFGGVWVSDRWSDEPEATTPFAGGRPPFGAGFPAGGVTPAAPAEPESGDEVVTGEVVLVDGDTVYVETGPESIEIITLTPTTEITELRASTPDLLTAGRSITVTTESRDPDADDPDAQASRSAAAIAIDPAP